MLDSNDPLRVEPVINSIDEVIVCATIVWAVNVPLTTKLSADEAVAANDDVNAWAAYDDVPSNEPVNDPVNEPVLNDPLNEFKDADTDPKLELMLFILLSNEELSTT